MKRFIFGFIFFITIFHLSYAQTLECSNEKVKFTVLQDDGTTIKVKAEKTQNIGLTVYPPGAGGSLLVLNGATCSDGRDKGVGAQTGKTSSIWTFTRTSPNVTLKFQSGSCGTLTIASVLPCNSPTTMRVVLVSTNGSTATVRAENPNNMFTMYPPQAGGTILELENATCNDGRGKGVGPQVNSDPKTWTFTKIDASKPAYLRWTKRPNGTQNCGNTKVLQF